MKVRFYIDPQTDQPHIYNHEVTEEEVRYVLAKPGEDRLGSEGSRVAIGRSSAGRYLRVIYVADPDAASVFIITAYELKGKPLTAYKRRRRRREG